MEEETIWEIELSEQIDYIRGSGLALTSDRTDPRVIESAGVVVDLQRRLDTLRMAREARWARACREVAPPETVVQLPREMAAVDDALFIFGREQGVYAIGVIPPAGPGKPAQRVAARSAVVAVPLAMLHAGLRDSIERDREARRQMARNEMIRTHGAAAAATPARLAEIERYVDAHAGFVVEGAARWDLPALAARFYGHRASTDGIREFEKRCDDETIRARWASPPEAA